MKTERQRKLREAHKTKAIADAEQYFVKQKITYKKLFYNMYRVTTIMGDYFYWPTTGRWSDERNASSNPSYSVEDFYKQIMYWSRGEI